MRKETRKELIGISQGAPTRQNVGTNLTESTHACFRQDSVWDGVQVLFLVKIVNATIGVSFDGDPPLQKFNETNSEKKICQNLKLDPKKVP